MRSIRWILRQTEPEWALTGKNISPGRQCMICNHTLLPIHTQTCTPIMRRICAGNVFVLLYPLSALFLYPPIFFTSFFISSNKSFVGAEMRNNFTSKSFSYCHFCNLKAMMHLFIFLKASGELCPRVFLPLSGAMLIMSPECELKYMRDELSHLISP